METTRCSHLPLLHICPASRKPCAAPVNRDSDASQLGTAVHRVMGDLVSQGLDELPDPESYAMRFGVDAQELYRLCSYGLEAWQDLRRYFSRPAVEKQVEAYFPLYDVQLVGHIDVAENAPGVIALLDWKSGRIERADVVHQLDGYVYCEAVSRGGEFTSISATAVWLRAQYLETFKYDWDAETQSLLRLFPVPHGVGRLSVGANIMAQLDEMEEHSPGSHCAFCQRQDDCVAWTGWARSSISQFLMVPSDAEKMTVEEVRKVIPKIEPQITALKHALEQYQELRKHALEEGGPIRLDNDFEIALEPVRRKAIVPLPAWPILMNWIGSEEALARCIKVGVGETEKAVKARMPRGQKKAEYENFLRELKDAGALKIATTDTVRRRRIKEER